MRNALLVISLVVGLCAAIGLALHVELNYFQITDEQATTYWVISKHVAALCLSAAFLKSLKCTRSNHWTRTLVTVIFIDQASDLTDELFFDPYTFQWNEIALLTLIALYLIYRANSYARASLIR